MRFEPFQLELPSSYLTHMDASGLWNIHNLLASFRIDGSSAFLAVAALTTCAAMWRHSVLVSAREVSSEAPCKELLLMMPGTCRGRHRMTGGYSYPSSRTWDKCLLRSHLPLHLPTGLSVNDASPPPLSDPLPSCSPVTIFRPPDLQRRPLWHTPVRRLPKDLLRPSFRWP